MSRRSLGHANNVKGLDLCDTNSPSLQAEPKLAGIENESLYVSLQISSGIDDLQLHLKLDACAKD